MTTLCHCGSGRTFARRAGGVASWLVPGALLALMPKCPVCLAGYVLLWTGIGLSASTAGLVRTLLIGACATMLVAVAARRACLGFRRSLGRTASEVQS